MHPVVTIDNQLTVPKEIREFLCIGPGDRLKFEPMADGRVAISRVRPRKRKDTDPFTRMKGSGKAGVTTEDIMRATRGSAWDK